MLHSFDFTIAVIITISCRCWNILRHIIIYINYYTYSVSVPIKKLQNSQDLLYSLNYSYFQTAWNLHISNTIIKYSLHTKTGNVYKLSLSHINYNNILPDVESKFRFGFSCCFCLSLITNDIFSTANKKSWGFNFIRLLEDYVVESRTSWFTSFK